MDGSKLKQITEIVPLVVKTPVEGPFVGEIKFERNGQTKDKTYLWPPLPEK